MDLEELNHRSCFLTKNPSLRSHFSLQQDRRGGGRVGIGEREGEEDGEGAGGGRGASERRRTGTVVKLVI